jgi:hypothetical protein
VNALNKRKSSLLLRLSEKRSVVSSNVKKKRKMTLMFQHCFLSRLAEAFSENVTEFFAFTASFAVYIINSLDQNVKITFSQQLKCV